MVFSNNAYNSGGKIQKKRCNHLSTYLNLNINEY